MAGFWVAKVVRVSAVVRILIIPFKVASSAGFGHKQGVPERVVYTVGIAISE
jgi:hypothetical protein